MEQKFDRRWLKWLHRFGYFATGVVLCQIVIIAVLAGRGWMQDRERSRRLVEESRTHETALMPTDDIHVRAAAIDLLANLTPLNALGGDGLRFVVMPSFGTIEYGLVIYLPEPDATHANGILTTVPTEDQKETIRHRSFRIPAQDYRSLMSQFDKLTDGWPGDEDGICIDGSPVAFERIRGQRITSGIGNCSSHYVQLKAMLLTFVRKFAAMQDLPTEGDWHRFEPEDRRNPR